MASQVESSALFCSSKFGFCTSDILFCRHSLVYPSSYCRLDPCVVAVGTYYEAQTARFLTLESAKNNPTKAYRHFVTKAHTRSVIRQVKVN